MLPMDDIALLQEYARTASEPAFAALVEHHVGLVYSAARRQVRDPHLAEDVTQAVFILLARKAVALARHPGLSGWLLQTTRYAANAHIRAAIRRTRREQEAAMQSELNEPSPAIWTQLEPLLDEAMAWLGKTDRAVLALRYFENKSASEIGRTLKLNEEAAKKRVSRALEKLRKFFTKRGVRSTAEIIAGAISANSVQAVPVALAKTVTVIAVAKGAAASVSTLTLIKGALKIMAWTKMTTTLVVAAAVVLTTSLTVVVIQRESLIEGKTETQWIKSIVYKGDYPQVRRWHALRLTGIHMLTKALLSPASDRATRMGAASLLCQLSTGLQDNRAPADETMRQDVKTALPDLLHSLQADKDDGVRANVLACFEELLPVMSEKEKAPFLPEFLRAVESNESSVRNNGLVALRSYPDQAQVVDSVLLAKLHDPEVVIRLRAADALVHVDVQTAIKAGVIPVLIEILKNQDDQIAWQVPGILGDMGPKAASAVPALIASTHGSSRLVADAATRALQQIGPASAK
jgi:RNA polymerase sigma factor (sigma-70 family)